MKNKFSHFLLLVLLGPTLLLAKERKEKTINPNELNIISLSEIVSNIETGMPLDNFRNMIIECPKGAELPIKMMVRGDLFSLEPNLITIKLLKTCYLKSSKGPLLISTDLKEWGKASDFFVTQAAAGLEFKDQMAQINLELELNQNTNPGKPLIYSKEEGYRQVFYWSSFPDNSEPTPVLYPESIKIKVRS